MARKSLIAREAKRLRLVKKYEAKRKELKEQGKYLELQLLPRNSCKTRLRNRCFVTGRSRGYMRDFGMSRITFREQARKGNLPGVKKSSW